MNKNKKELFTSIVGLDFENLEDFVSKNKIKATPTKNTPYLVCYCYNHLETPKNEKTDLFRSLVLDLKNKKVVSKSFTRFHDYDPKQKADFDFSDFYALEKIDGSLMNLYCHDGNWMVSTKGTPDGLNPINDYPDDTLSSMFFRALLLDVENDMSVFEPAFTYTFEMKYPSERSFLTRDSNPKPNLTLLGIQHNGTFEDMIPDAFYFNNLKKLLNYPKKIYGKTIEQLIEMANNLDPIESEGFVLVDKNFNRLKLKSPNYLLIELLSQKNPQFNKKRLIDMIKHNDHKTFLGLPKYEVYRVDYDLLSEKFHKMVRLIEDKLSEKVVLEDPKTKVKNEVEIKSLKSFSLNNALDGFAFRDFINSQQKDLGRSVRSMFLNMDGDKILKMLNLLN